jgi:hypothetical protein
MYTAHGMYTMLDHFILTVSCMTTHIDHTTVQFVIATTITAAIIETDIIDHMLTEEEVSTVQV